MSTASLAARLAVVQQALAFAIVLAFAGSSLWLTAQVLRRQQDTTVADAAQRLARAFDDELREGPDPRRAADAVAREEATPGVQVELVDAAGRLLAASPAPRRTGAGTRREHARTAVARSASGTTVRATISDGPYRAGFAALGWSLLLSALPLLAASLILGRTIARRALRPLSAMADRAADISVEEGARSLGGPTGLEEIDRLRASFDRVLERLDDALRAERQFTADASHELRTPLTVLSGELEMAGGRAGADPRLGRSLASAAEQVRAMRELVEAILLLHRSGETRGAVEAEFEPVNLADVVREVVAEAGPRHPARGGDICVQTPDEVLVRGDPALLASALRNLVDNALKFTRAGQPVQITVRAIGGGASLVVDDGGPGIPDHERRRVCDPFFRGAEARAGGSGFGLGLPILRRVARAHGGDVVLGQSALGGAQFTLTLPTLESESS